MVRYVTSCSAVSQVSMLASCIYLHVHRYPVLLLPQLFPYFLAAGALHWQSPNFFAWFAGNRSGPSILAEMLIAALNMIGFSWQSSPVSTELEMVRGSWMDLGVCLLHFYGPLHCSS